tara:strand:+ start:3448 stop:3771 length:324 start_codon:yes stop_codon:yes gene_type:complete
MSNYKDDYDFYFDKSKELGSFDSVTLRGRDINSRGRDGKGEPIIITDRPVGGSRGRESDAVERQDKIIEERERSKYVLIDEKNKIQSFASFGIIGIVLILLLKTPKI